MSLCLAMGPVRLLQPGFGCAITAIELAQLPFHYAHGDWAARLHFMTNWHRLVHQSFCCRWRKLAVLSHQQCRLRVRLWKSM